MDHTRIGNSDRASTGEDRISADHLEVLRLSQLAIVKHLGRDSGSLERVAQALGLSERTLQRRLRLCGWGFTDLLEAVRRTHAEALLRESAMSLVEVALTVGYSDQTAFTRAFKRWTSSTPRAYRRNGHGEGMASRYLFKGHMADPDGRWPDCGQRTT